MRETKNHYSIRKLTIGAASVLIGVSFLGVKHDTVHADIITQEAKNTTYDPATKSLFPLGVFLV